MRKIFSILFFVFIGFLVAPSSVSASMINDYDGVLNDGTYFNFGEEVITSEFSEDGSLESVIIDSAPIFTKNEDISYRNISSGTWIAKAYWITRDGMKSISIYPNISKAGFTGAKGWSEIVANFSHYSDWRNVSVLKQQYDCHVRYGKLKVPWNIEPSKTSINSVTCN